MDVTVKELIRILERHNIHNKGKIYSKNLVIIMDKESTLKELKKRTSTFKRIYEWNTRADKEEVDNSITKFIFRWISFNGLYSALYAIDQFKQNKADRAGDMRKIENFCTKYIKTDKTIASKIFSDDKTRVFKKETSGLERYLNGLDENIDIEEKAISLVWIAYKIRCRLFHGEKNPNLEVNNKVVEAADQVITPIINYFLKFAKRL